jgi:chromosomal replication initiator protein
VDVSLTEEAIDWLITTFCTPFSISRALHALSLRMHRSAKEVRLCTLTDLLSDLVDEEKKRQLTSDCIIQEIAGYFGIKKEDLLGKSKEREHSLPRQIAMYSCRTMLHMPFHQIGKIFARDHSTVMSNVKLIEEQKKKKDPSITRFLQEIHIALTKSMLK